MTLPPPGKLREQSRLALMTAGHGANAAANARLIDAALILAQVAQVIDSADATADVTRLERMVADALTSVPTEGRATDLADRIKRWRMRAEELRAVADQMVDPSAQEPLRRSAANYERFADEAEAKLSGKPATRTDEVG